MAPNTTNEKQTCTRYDLRVLATALVYVDDNGRPIITARTSFEPADYNAYSCTNCGLTWDFFDLALSHISKVQDAA